ncbi:YCF48-related protein [Aquipseudomonas alcaligenes]|uniref:Photosynthesis system II assembly factor Ycf48/Hcf136-like domain-containing protein n=1 Tax=Aquipseudomonas alcaligenes TaxID=43263 RepID=A0A1N6NPK1_AQUAC|nr:YCF48-related protein [Pseudomonas alcaligenes]SIP93973.1 Uncharacterized protein SAMN05878282_101451 [Pseudomonas alcaligenes]
MMFGFRTFTPLLTVLLCSSLFSPSQVLAEDIPALHLPGAQHAPMVALTRAGERLVAAGDHGVILLGDDPKTWRQATSVPVDALLTGLSFTDALHGWAVGHEGVVLNTEDGGEHWKVQHLDDRPVLLSILMLDGGIGIVTGAYGYAARTTDAGKSWTPIRVSADDYHLNQIFAGPEGSLYIAAEAGQLYRSYDAGLNWKALDTGVDGSLWTGQSLRDGRILVAGMSGRLLMSADKGETWQAIQLEAETSITDIAELRDGRIAMVGNGGMVASADARLTNFKTLIRPDRQGLAALLPLGSLNIVYASGVGVGMQPLPR